MFDTREVDEDEVRRLPRPRPVLTLGWPQYRTWLRAWQRMPTGWAGEVWMPRIQGDPMWRWLDASMLQPDDEPRGRPGVGGPPWILALPDGWDREPPP